MRAFFLTGSIIFTVLILILAFENMAIQLNGFMFLFTAFNAPFFVVMGLCIVGIIAGAFYTGLIITLAKHGSQDEESGGNEW
jgi:uncharacterized integral membrane protein